MSILGLPIDVPRHPEVPTASSTAAQTLVTLPTDALEPILQFLYDRWFLDIHREFQSEPHFDYERCPGQYLLALSCSCRYMRAQTLPWIFREVYNWDSPRGRVWPESSWPYFRTVHLRDHTAQKPYRPSRKLELSPETIRSVSVMPSLTRISIRLESSIPWDLLYSISLAPSLRRLEIHQACLDGEFPSSSLPFPALDTLLISIAGFRSIASREGVDDNKEGTNVHSLLRAVNSRLTELSISGDLLSPPFTSVEWPQIRRLTITEHPPTPFIPVVNLVANMPKLRDLQVLYTSDMTNGRGPSSLIRLGDASLRNLYDRCSVLFTAKLGNVRSDDPIFAQLPASLCSLYLRAPVDPYDARWGFPQKAHLPLDKQTFSTALDNLRHLEDLKELCFDLDSFVTAPFIEHIASALPQVEVLEFYLPQYPFMSSPYRFDERGRDPALLAALNRFPHLRHLRLTMDLPREWWDPHYSEQVNAQWLLSGVPTLATVSFAWPKEMYLVGYDMAGWRKWDSGVFNFTFPTPPPSPDPVENLYY
ncbi:hypothetical protein R3P38DRAFT_2688768 [Favolaschia claudopus]|uniref:F-box domain-containing protein n=1 Tax=Favolaschia claudopus TaxID=2862362 RepID=A0AAW0D1N9_9AGAR